MRPRRSSLEQALTIAGLQNDALRARVADDDRLVFAVTQALRGCLTLPADDAATVLKALVDSLDQLAEWRAEHEEALR
jgi:hypothetical protein